MYRAIRIVLSRNCIVLSRIIFYGCCIQFKHTSNTPLVHGMVDHLLSPAMHTMDYHSRFSIVVLPSRPQIGQNQPAVLAKNTSRNNDKLARRFFQLYEAVHYYYQCLNYTTDRIYCFQSSTIQYKTEDNHSIHCFRPQNIVRELSLSMQFPLILKYERARSSKVSSLF
jgi:hypothetical protein